MEENMEMNHTKIQRNYNIYCALYRLKQGDALRGVDNRQIALVTIGRRKEGYSVGIEYETKDNDGYFTHRYETIVDTLIAAIEFFDDFWLGDITWGVKNVA